MIGNDVVDLGDPEAQPKALNPRFDARVFTEGERSQIEQSSSEHEMRWMLWACKEATYKLAKRDDHRTIFSPVAFEVSIAGPALAFVCFGDRTTYVRLSRFGDAVHAVAAQNQTDLDCSVAEVKDCRSDQSRVVRDLALGRIAKLHAVPISAVAIENGPARIPEIRLYGEPSPHALSLSHHGRYVAFAIHTAAL